MTMYRVVVKSKGRHNNAKLGARYCFTKHSVIELAVTFMEFGCEFEVEKLVRLHGDIFSWSASDVSEKIWDKIYETLEGEDEDAEV